MDKSLLDERKSHYVKPIIKVKRPTLPFIPSDKASRRVIAPYVNIVRKSKKIAVKDDTNKYIKAFLQKKPSILVSTLKEFLEGIVELPILIHESIDALKIVTSSIGGRLYLVDDFLNEIFVSPKEDPFPKNRLSLKIEKGKTVAAHVAATQEAVLSEDILIDARFSHGVPFIDLTLKSVLSAPILTETGVCYGVVELYRDCSQKSFKQSDTKIVLVVLGWIGSSIRRNNERIKVLHQKQLDDCLIELTRTYFSHNISIDNLISELVKFAKSAVNAEKASLFVMHPDNELIADIYDQGLPDYGGDMVKRHEKVKLAKEKGVVSYVAKNKKSILVKDAYRDKVFHKEIDPNTGMITRSVLCVPVLSMNSLLGIILGINKTTGDSFTDSDLEIFNTFAVYCSLCLQHYNLSKGYNVYRARYEIISGLMKRHIFPNEHDLQELVSNPEFSEDIETLNTFNWYINLDYTDEMPQIAVYLIMSIADEGDIDIDQLYKFVLSMRMLYRKNIYHNWEHGFNVCHCMRTIIKHNMEKFTAIERKTLAVAALGHDVDHGGVTNGFLRLTNDVMAELYEESTWECHHYDITMILLGEIPIYKNCSPEEYKTISDLIYSAIIATDLVNYFKTSAKLNFMIQDEIFDIEHPLHRVMMIGVMMTVADLSGQCKDFEVTNRITMNLYEEFYNQGDMEKLMGFVPLAMMDREKISAVPSDQVHFLQVLVIPCCDLLTKIFPNTLPLLDGAVDLKRIWTNIVEKNDTKWWSPNHFVSNKLYENDLNIYKK
nr:cAMP and cAMP-inhibited cGMP 3',5'-cyclic phosphodiesterase 10A-like [Onthophagus taurus]